MRALGFLAILALASCSESPSSPSSLTSQTALNGAFRLTSYQPPGLDFVIPLPSGSNYQATFENSSVSARIDCNTCNASLARNGSSLTIGPALACTRAACGANDPINNELTSILAGSHEASEVPGGFRLRSGRGTISLQRQ